ncbi:MAG: class I SAM-dependent methyltransferase [Actinobacteria bacterium]|nr:class I SAM-dependent methyltransferase [Actinomycetota bacterium]
MYDRRTAALYDAIYRGVGKDYAAEAATVAQVVHERAPAAATLLDVACGTGGHLEHLRRAFACEGVEGSEHMAGIARTKLPDLPVHVADMRSLDLGRTFDAVTCLFSSVGYLLEIDDLRRGIGRMAAHVAPGGVLVIEPWLDPEAWRDGHVAAVAGHGDDLAVARVSRSHRVGRRSVLEMHYTVATRAGVDRFSEQEVLALHPAQAHRSAMVDAGLATSFEPEGLTGRGLWIGVRPG